MERLRRNPESVEELVHGKGPADPGEMLAVAAAGNAMPLWVV
ncbi:MAG TPA: hypothetical protein VIH75_17000 [Candidatus Sulfotelmatobacter sp.]